MNNSGITSVVINGETISLRFGIPATRMFLEKTVEDSGMISGETINEIGIATLMLCGYINNCMVTDSPQTKTFGFFLEYVELAYVDEAIKKQLVKVAKVYGDSKFSKKIVETMKDNIEDSKKK